MAGFFSRPEIRRFRRWLLWASAILIGVPLALLVVVLVAGNIGWFRRIAERQTASATGGQVAIAGIEGRFPDRLRLRRVELRDAHGMWLEMDDVALDWSPWALFTDRAELEEVSVARLRMSRLPVPATPTSPSQPANSGFSLPVRVVVASLRIARAELGPQWIGAPAALSVEGSGEFRSLEQATARLAIDRLDAAGRYRLDAAADRGALRARLDMNEPAGGLIGGLARLPDLGALSVAASIDGPRAAERTDIRIEAGALRALANGVVDIVSQSAALDFSAHAPPMQPRPDLGWRAIALQGRLRGPFATPDADLHLSLDGVTAGGATLSRASVDLTANRVTADLHAMLAGLRLPGPHPDVLAAVPVDLTAHADLLAAGRPVRFVMKHALVTAEGLATTTGDPTVTIHAKVPDLAPLAGLANLALQGRLDATGVVVARPRDIEAKLDGTAELTGGQLPTPGLLTTTRFGATATVAGPEISISRAQVDSRAIHISVTGTDGRSGLDLAWRIGLPNLAAVSPAMIGALQLTGTAVGMPDDVTLRAQLDGDLGTAQIPRGPLHATLKATGLPAKAQAALEAQGTLDRSQLLVSADLRRDGDGTLHGKVSKAEWKSLNAAGRLDLAAGQRVPAGHVSVKIGRLADLAPLIGQPIAGAIQADIDLAERAARPAASIDLRGAGLSAPGGRVDRVTVAGNLTDLPAEPTAALTLTLSGIAASGLTGDARLAATGPLRALALRADAGLHNVAGSDATFTASALLDAHSRRVTVQSLRADAKGETLTLRAPARIDFGQGVAVDRLSLGLGAASLEIAGRISPTLALTAAIRNITPDLARQFAPSLNAQGVLNANATLAGTTASPTGSLSVRASGLRMRQGPAASVPAAEFQLNAQMAGGAARIDGKFDAGPKLRLAVAGTAPVGHVGALDLRMVGALDLRLLDPVLAADGRRVAGQLALNGTIGGTAQAPSVAGTATIEGGEIQDFVQGLHLSDLAGRIDAAGDTVRIVHLAGRAGPGTISASGSAGILAPGIPVDLHLLAAGAQPLASDLLTTTLDADLTLAGQAAGVLAARGKILVHRADINIPESLPPGVAVLNVRRPGDRPAPRAVAQTASVSLDIAVDAPRNIFVRGHGLDAEMGGTLQIGGTAAVPSVTGGFQLRRGDFSLAGTTLTFSKGEVGFNGSSVLNRIDPTLDFTADSTGGGVTATLAVLGYADAPKIILSSVPDLPQDEVLAHLLFGTSMKNLSPFQIAEIGGALAQISGVIGSGSPLGSIRKRLGLDRLSVGGGGAPGAGPTVEAGRYVARGVYVGAKQSTSGGGGTTAQVQVDLTRRLKAKASVAAGGGSVQGSTPQNDTGTTLGLSYQFEY